MSAITPIRQQCACGHDRASHAWFAITAEGGGGGGSGSLAYRPSSLTTQVSGDCLCTGCTCKGYRKEVQR